MLLSEFEDMMRTPADGSCGLANPERVKCLIIDCFGLLSSLYRYGDIAYVGGGFGAGIHNINEAAVYGMPIIIGPKYKKFKEARDLISIGGAYSIKNTEELSSIVGCLIEDSDKLIQVSQIAKDYIQRNLGATDIIYRAIFQ